MHSAQQITFFKCSPNSSTITNPLAFPPFSFRRFSLQNVSSPSFIHPSSEASHRQPSITRLAVAPVPWSSAPMSPICPLNPSPQLRPGLSLTPHWTHRLLQGSRLSAGPHLNMPPNGIGRHPHLTSTQEFQRPLGRNLQNPTILHWRSWPFGKAWRNGAPHKKCGLLEVTNFKSSELSNREISQNSKEWNFKGKPLPFYWCVNSMIWHLSYYCTTL